MKSITPLLLAIALVTSQAARAGSDALDWLGRAQASAAAFAKDAAESGRIIALLKEATGVSNARNGANGNGQLESLEWLSSAVAAYVILERLLPEGRETYEQDLAVLASHAPETNAKARAMAVGRERALRFLENRALTP